MTTKKKNSPNDPESKADSFREAQRQDERASDLWARSSPTMADMFRAFEGFRTSFEEALAAVDGFVSESRRVSGELRTEQCEAKANALEWWADEWTGVTTPAFHKAATGIVELVYSALVNAYPVRVLKVEGPLLDSGLAEWGRLCASQRYVLRVGSPGQREASHPFAVELISELKRIDDRAKGLTADQVIEVANGPTSTDAGFAAKLASMCKAFGYDWKAEEGAKEDPEKAQLKIQDRAQRAIAKAMKGGRDPN